jgi:hypothetical protein
MTAHLRSWRPGEQRGTELSALLQLRTIRITVPPTGNSNAQPPA